MGFAEPGRSPGLLVSSYLTVSPLPTSRPAGGLLSVALSLTLRPVGVTHHRAPWSPDFPPALPRNASRGVEPAIVRSASVLIHGRPRLYTAADRVIDSTKQDAYLPG